MKEYDSMADYDWSPRPGERVRIEGEAYEVREAEDGKRPCKGCSFQPGKCSQAPVCIVDEHVHVVFRKEGVSPCRARQVSRLNAARKCRRVAPRQVSP